MSQRNSVQMIIYSTGWNWGLIYTILERRILAHSLRSGTSPGTAAWRGYCGRLPRRVHSAAHDPTRTSADDQGTSMRTGLVVAEAVRNSPILPKPGLPAKSGSAILSL